MPRAASPARRPPADTANSLHKRGQGGQARAESPPAHSRTQDGVIGLEMATAASAAHPLPAQPDRTEARFQFARLVASGPHGLLAAGGTGRHRPQRRLGAPRFGESLTHQRLPPGMHPLLQGSEIQRLIRDDQWDSYHQFHGDLLAAGVTDARCYREDRPRSSSLSMTDFLTQPPLATRDCHRFVDAVQSDDVAHGSTNLCETPMADAARVPSLSQAAPQRSPLLWRYHPTHHTEDIPGVLLGSANSGLRPAESIAVPP